MMRKNTKRESRDSKKERWKALVSFGLTQKRSSLGTIYLLKISQIKRTEKMEKKAERRGMPTQLREQMMTTTNSTYTRMKMGILLISLN